MAATTFKTRIPRVSLPIRVLMGVTVAALLVAAISVNAKPSLRILYTGNVRGFIEPCGCPGAPAGGITRRATFLGQRASLPNVLLDGGELLSDDTPIDRMQTIYLFRAMQEMGYRTLGVGPNDFSYGREFIEFVAEEFGFTLVSTNITDTNGEPVFAPYAIEEVTDTGFFGQQRIVCKVGILSVIGEDRPIIAPLTDPPLHVIDPVAAVQNAVAKLRHSVDVIVLMAHVSTDVLDELRRIDGVDTILMMRVVRIPGRYVISNNKTTIGYSTIEGRGVGEIDITLHNRRVKSASGTLTMLLDTISEDEVMIEIREEFEVWKERFIRAHSHLESRER